MFLPINYHGLGRGAGVGRCLGVGRGTGVPGGPAHHVKITLSMRHPSPEPLVSLAIRHRSLTDVTTGAPRFTTVVIKPAEFPLHA